MKEFNFPITLVGRGETMEEAWFDAVAGFMEGDQLPPDEGEYTEEECESEDS
jgi:hypothetical protein